MKFSQMTNAQKVAHNLERDRLLRAVVNDKQIVSSYVAYLDSFNKPKSVSSTRGLLK